MINAFDDEVKREMMVAFGFFAFVIILILGDGIDLEEGQNKYDVVIGLLNGLSFIFACYAMLAVFLLYGLGLKAALSDKNNDDNIYVTPTKPKQNDITKAPKKPVVRFKKNLKNNGKGTKRR